jgi:hypothetical protein
MGLTGCKMRAVMMATPSHFPMVPLMATLEIVMGRELHGGHESCPQIVRCP